jgi:hypothetical protein
MPFVSKKQNAWGHTPAGIKALGGADKVKEWEAATDYQNLPERVPAPKMPNPKRGLRFVKMKGM